MKKQPSKRRIKARIRQGKFVSLGDLRRHNLIWCYLDFGEKDTTAFMTMIGNKIKSIETML